MSQVRIPGGRAMLAALAFLAVACTVRDHATPGAGPVPRAVSTRAAAGAEPASVGIPGSYQSEVGCPGDWQPDCPATQLAFDPADGVWQGTFTLPAGSWEYKAALNGTWDENYGANAQRNGPNIGLVLAAPTAVKFYYDHGTHWVTSNANSVIATVPGSFQSELGCPGDWQPDCLRSWLEDPDGDGIYEFETTALPAGSYEAKVAIGESWDLNYGEGGVQNGANIPFVVPADGAPILFRWDSATKVLRIVAGGGNLALAQAHWVLPDVVAWDVSAIPAGAAFRLHAASDGGLAIGSGGVEGGTSLPLTLDPAGLPAEVVARFPQLAHMAALRLAPEDVALVPDVLRGEVAVSAIAGGVVQDATSLQIPGVLDALYANDLPLGPAFAGGVPTLRVWAPTAKSVTLRLFDDSTTASSTAVPMTLDTATGTWSATGDPSWTGKFYLYEVRVWAPAAAAVVTNLVTDPYSLSLSMNSGRSQIVSLDDPALAPDGWRETRKPPLAAPVDIVIYELHVRDFSATDPTVPEALRGTFLAFTLDSLGTRHLARLAQAGLTHVHVLPAFDFATVNEDRSTWQVPQGDLSAFPPDSAEQQARVVAVAGEDGFNWGYDPWHFTVPEGSYSTAPDGPARIREFRAMVQALNRMGLRAVMDVVYNHTNASGQAQRSVLDRIVPGYYHRLDGNGGVEHSTCCENTATEHAMMEKLMVDSVVTWARAYKVDGFRFDLMGHHMKSNMLKVRAALDALTPERDGVDGRAIYVYGEGWNFGEVANDARGVNATQLNMAGTGIGTFSDRLRDAVRGGGPFSPRRDQGFATGLGLDPNGTWSAPPGEQTLALLHESDLVRLGMAGNLAGYVLRDMAGDEVPGSAIDYNGQPAGYAADPQEIIAYISAHDNETWFDAMNVKLPRERTMAERLRAYDLGVSIVALSQGVPFFLAGDDVLRSKSGDKNSYDSGDWFNRIDWTLQWNGWGSGLPPEGQNGGDWDLLGPFLADPALRPAPEDIAAARDHLEEMLRIRRSSRLFRLRTGEDVRRDVSFLNTGPDQIPGLVVMRIAAPDPPPGDWDQVVVVVNAAPGSRAFTAAELRGRKLFLHPVQRGSSDHVVQSARFKCSTGTFTVPGRTVAVFVPQPSGASRVAPACGD